MGQSPKRSFGLIQSGPFFVGRLKLQVTGEREHEKTLSTAGARKRTAMKFLNADLS
jgi:hypothetical protein